MASVRCCHRRRNGARRRLRAINIVVEADIDARPAQLTQGGMEEGEGASGETKGEGDEPAGTGRRKAEVGAVEEETMSVSTIIFLGASASILLIIIIPFVHPPASSYLRLKSLVCRHASRHCNCTHAPRITHLNHA